MGPMPTIVRRRGQKIKAGKPAMKGASSLVHLLVAVALVSWLVDWLMSWLVDYLLKGTPSLGTGTIATAHVLLLVANTGQSQPGLR